MAEVVIPLWDIVVTVESEVLDVFARAFQTIYALFCAYYWLMASPTPTRLKADLNMLMGLFDRVRIQKYVVKMVGMKCLP